MRIKDVSIEDIIYFAVSGEDKRCTVTHVLYNKIKFKDANNLKYTVCEGLYGILPGVISVSRIKNEKTSKAFAEAKRKWGEKNPADRKSANPFA